MNDARPWLWCALLVALVAAALPFSVPGAMLSYVLERVLTLWVAASSGIAVLTACVGIGLLALPRELVRRDIELGLLLALGCGVGLLSCIVLIMGLVPGSALTTGIGWCIVFGAVAGGAFRLYPVLRARLLDSKSETPTPAAGAQPGLVALFFFVGALGCILITTVAPPLLFDVTEYHLGAWHDNTVALKSMHGEVAMRFAPVPHNFYARFPFPIESIYWLGLLLSQPLDFAPKFINSAFVIACAWLVMRMLREAAGRGIALLGGALVLLQPVMREVSLDAFIDAPLAFLVTAAIYTAFVLPTRELYVSFLLFGSALAAKYTVAQLYLLPYLGVVAGLRGQALINIPVGRPRVMMACAAALIAVPCVWLGKNVIMYGNPLEPFFAWLFRPGSADAIAREKFYIASHYPQPLWTAGYWMTLVPRLKEFGWILLPLAVAAPWLSRRPRSDAGAVHKVKPTALLLFCLVSYLLWNFTREAQNRFLLPCILLVVYCACVTVAAFSERWVRRGLYGILCLYCAFHLGHQVFTLANSGEFKYFAEYDLTAGPADATADESAQDAPREEFYRKNLGALGEVLPAANALPPSARILLIYEARPYLFHRETVVNTVWDDSELLRMAGNAKSAQEVRQRLRENSITHVLVNRQELRRYIQQYATDEQLRQLRISPRADRALAYHATDTPEDLFPPFYRAAAWPERRAAIIEFLAGLRANASAVAGKAPTEIYLAPLK